MLTHQPSKNLGGKEVVRPEVRPKIGRTRNEVVWRARWCGKLCSDSNLLTTLTSLLLEKKKKRRFLIYKLWDPSVRWRGSMVTNTNLFSGAGVI